MEAYRKVRDQMTVTPEGLVLKEEKIVLPANLRKMALDKAHQGGGHPGVMNLKRRIRSHFHWPGLNEDLRRYVAECKECAMHTQKNRKNMLVAHELSGYNSWEKLSLDLFGPMPDSGSILVAQDMVSRFPAAKILKRTDVDHVT